MAEIKRVLVKSDNKCSNHKKYRNLIKKLKRKAKRRTLATSKEKSQENSVSEDEEKGISDENLKWISDEEERNKAHVQWLEREKLAHEEFLKKKKLEERLAKEQQEQEERIREEWETQQKKEKEEEEERTLLAEKKKEREEALLAEATSQIDENEGPWHNPIQSSTSNRNQDQNICPFFLKTGACRFGERCSRVHDRPVVSSTILIPGMYTHFYLGESFHDEYDTDISLEYEDSETYQHFRDFYDDVIAEFKKVGKIIQFKVCTNHEPHLRGNVYVQYKREEDALQAYQMFNGRWYAGRQLSCEFTNINKWRAAICGLFASKRCPKGKGCNFLHVFRNPHNEYSEIERLDMSSRSWQHSSREYSQRDRNSYSRHRSRSPGSSRRRRSYSRSPSPSKRRSRSHSRSPETSKSSRRRRSYSRSPSPSKRRSRSRSKSPDSSRRSSGHLRRRRSHSNSKSPELSKRKRTRSSSRSPSRKQRKSKLTSGSPDYSKIYYDYPNNKDKSGSSHKQRHSKKKHKYRKKAKSSSESDES